MNIHRRCGVSNNELDGSIVSDMLHVTKMTAKNQQIYSLSLGAPHVFDLKYF